MNRREEIARQIADLEAQIKDSQAKITSLRQETREIEEQEASDASYFALCRRAEAKPGIVLTTRGFRASNWADRNRSFMTLHKEKHLIVEGETQTKGGKVVLTIRVRPDLYSAPYVKRTKSFDDLLSAHDGVEELANKALQEAVIRATKERNS